ncbi:MAG: hypothetical protein K2G83_00665, partial [Ruminococcus sp.]|nr:hypothetical protein [Ruminococcus sp.]
HRKKSVISDVTDSINGVDVILNQHNDFFKGLKLGESMMYDVACEVMAAYNAVSLANSEKYNYYRIALEFDLNAIWNFPEIVAEIGVYFSPDAKILGQKAGAGSNFLKIGDYLEAYNVDYARSYTPLIEYDAYDNSMSLYLIESFLNNAKDDNPAVVVTYFNPNSFYIHTITFTINEDGKIYSINKDLSVNKPVETGELINYMDSDYMYLCIYYCV